MNRRWFSSKLDGLCCNKGYNLTFNFPHLFDCDIEASRKLLHLGWFSCLREILGFLLSDQRDCLSEVMDGSHCTHLSVCVLCDCLNLLTVYVRTELMTDAWVAVVLTARNEEGSLLKKYYRFTFVCSSSQTLLNRKEVNRDIFQGFQGVSLSASSKLLNIQQRCAITNPHFAVTVQREYTHLFQLASDFLIGCKSFQSKYLSPRSSKVMDMEPDFELHFTFVNKQRSSSCAETSCRLPYLLSVRYLVHLKSKKNSLWRISICWRRSHWVVVQKK